MEIVTAVESIHESSLLDMGLDWENTGDKWQTPLVAELEYVDKWLALTPLQWRHSERNDVFSQWRIPC